MSVLEATLDSRHARLTLLLVALLMWAFVHPVITFWHDARLYAVLAMHWLTPDAYARDPFFMFGSQGDFSLFPLLYGTLIKHFGLRSAHTMVMAIGGVLWCVAAVRVSLACMANNWLAGVAALALAVLSINYSPNGDTFVLNENFATARTLAFPLGALALAECVNGRWWWGALLSAAPMLLHPLLGVWPLALSVLWPLSWRWRWCLIGSSILALGMLMFSQLGPFARFDAEWEPIARQTRDVFVYLPFSEKPMRWRGYVFQLLLLITTAWYARSHVLLASRLYALVALVAASGLLVAVFASWFWPSKLVIQSQLWRSMWLAAYLLPVALTHLLWLLAKGIRRRTSGGMPWWLMLVGVALLALREWPLALLLAWWAGVAVREVTVRRGDAAVWQRICDELVKAGQRRWFIGVVFLALAVVIPGLRLDLWMLGLSIPMGQREIEAPELIGLFFGGGYGIGFLLMAGCVFRFGKHALAPWVVAVLLALILWNWDVRAKNIRAWEENSASFGMQEGLKDLIQPGEVVLWQSRRMPLETWYDLRTAHYAGGEQSTGLVFSRDKTFELLARTQRIRDARALEGHADDKPFEAKDMFDFLVPEGQGIAALCRDPQLDWIVIQPKKKPELPGGTPVVYDDMSGQSVMLYAYRCSDFRTVH